MSFEHFSNLVMKLKSGSAPLDYTFPDTDVSTTTFIDLADMIYSAGWDITPAYRSGTLQHFRPSGHVAPWLHALNHSSRIAEGISSRHNPSPIS